MRPDQVIELAHTEQERRVHVAAIVVLPGLSAPQGLDELDAKLAVRSPCDEVLEEGADAPEHARFALLLRALSGNRRVAQLGNRFVEGTLPGTTDVAEWQ